MTGNLPSSEFDLETQTNLESQNDESSIWSGHVFGNWNIGDNPNGGYLISLCLGPIAKLLPHPHPLTLTTHFLRPGTPDAECIIRVEVLRTGRALSTAQATLEQDGKTRVEVLTTFGDLNTQVGVDTTLSIPAPTLPPPDTCMPRTGDAQGIHLPIMQRLSVQLAESAPVEVQDARVAGWISCKDGRDPDALILPMFTDAFPPSVFNRLGVVGWVPTVELTVHVRGIPAPGWVMGEFKTQDLHHGRMIEDGCLWDSAGQLVAQSRQVGLVMQRDP